MYRPTIEKREGFSAVDHFIDEVIYFANDWLKSQPESSQSKTGYAAGKLGERAVKWCLKNKYANAKKTYGQLGLTLASFKITASKIS